MPLVNEDKLDPTETYVLEETVTTKSLTLEQLARIALGDEDSRDSDSDSDFDFDAALQAEDTPAE